MRIGALLIIACLTQALPSFAQTSNAVVSPAAPSGVISSTAATGPKSEADALAISSLSESIGGLVTKLKGANAAEGPSGAATDIGLLSGNSANGPAFVFDAPPLSSAQIMAVLVTDRQLQDVTSNLTTYTANAQVFNNFLVASQQRFGHLKGLNGKPGDIVGALGTVGDEITGVAGEATASYGIITDAVGAVTTTIKTFKSQYAFTGEGLSPDQDMIDRVLNCQIRKVYKQSATVYDFSKVMITAIDAAHEPSISIDYDKFSAADTALQALSASVQSFSSQVPNLASSASSLNGTYPTDPYVVFWMNQTNVQTMTNDATLLSSQFSQLSPLATALMQTMSGSATSTGSPGSSLATLAYASLLIDQIKNIPHLFLVSCRPLIVDATTTPITRAIFEDQVAISSAAIVQLQVFDMSNGMCIFADQNEVRGYDLYRFSTIRSEAERKVGNVLMVPSSQDDPTARKTYAPRLTHNFSVTVPDSTSSSTSTPPAGKTGHSSN